ncbi:MAG: hypothetical protein ABW123_25710 [Cystobacter sp.]
MSKMRRCRIVLVLLGAFATASMATPAMDTVVREVMATDSLRSHTFGLLARGQVAEAIDYWALTTGKEIPAWLVAFRTSFDTSKQIAGACQGVAQNIHTAFTRLGGKPEFVQLTTESSAEANLGYMMFKLANGGDVSLSHTGYHVLVRMQGRAYDAYTGAAGMPWTEYVGRVGTHAPLIEKVVETTVRAR